MPRIIGVDVPKDKRVDTALTYIHGIGATSSLRILKAAGVAPGKRAKDLTGEEVSKIASIIQKDYKVEGDLKRDVTANIKRLVEISAYRGIRHRRGLPVRGQRTKTNARTRKGPRKTVGVQRKKEAKGGAAASEG